MTTDGETIASLCAMRPLALPILQQLGVPVVDASAAIDTCCAAAGVSTLAVLGAIAAAETTLAARWRGRSLDELMDDVVRTYHRPFAVELAKVNRAFEAARTASGDPRWSAMLAELAELEVDLAEHIAMEERVVFPQLRMPIATSARFLIRAMQLGHGDAITHLLAIEAQTNKIDGETSGSGALACLHHFERWLCEHIHLEANALFSRALELARS